MTEIQNFVDGVVDGTLSDDDIEGWMRNVFDNGLSTEDTVAFTDAMLHSGVVLQWPQQWSHLVVDKHSTGGIGDKVSLPLAPALAACGLKCPMIAGRGLAHTGGTLDKLESLPGYDVALTPEAAQNQVVEIGCMIAGQTGDFAPADKRMYAIRDVTGLIASTPLITGSILSKKAAEGLAALVIDIKVGKATFMRDEEMARQLANSIVSTGEGLGIHTTVMLTEMNTPLGFAAGNALEVLESIETLRGCGPADLEELVCVQGGILLAATGLAHSANVGAVMILDSLHDGSAIARFEQMCIAQGVAAEVFASEHSLLLALGLLDETLQTTEFHVAVSGHVADIDAMALGTVVLELGGGRSELGDDIDHGVGFVLDAHVGSEVDEGESWITVYHREPLSDEHTAAVRGSLTIIEDEVKVHSRIIGIL